MELSPFEVAVGLVQSLAPWALLVWLVSRASRAEPFVHWRGPKRGSWEEVQQDVFDRYGEFDFTREDDGHG